MYESLNKSMKLKENTDYIEEQSGIHNTNPYNLK